MPFNTRVQLDAATLTNLQHISAIYDSLETAIMSLYDDCREKALAVTNLEQSHMWLIKMLERAQLEQNFRSGNSIPKPIPPKEPPKDMSPDAQVLAESRLRLESLKDSLKELTNTVALNGFPPITKG